MTVDAALVALIAGIVIPLLNALLTKLTASPDLKSLVAVVLAAVTAVAASVADVHGAVSVKAMGLVFLLTLVSATGHRFTWLSPVENAVARKTANAGVGGHPVDVVHGPNDPHFGEGGQVSWLMVVIIVAIVVLVIAVFWGWRP